MKEEDYIRKKVGSENAFKVPEGYFENITSVIVRNLPEKEQQFKPAGAVSRWERIKPLVYMAAMFIGAALIIQVGLFLSPEDAAKKENQVAVSQNESELDDEYIDYIIDASMLDDYELYVYLSEAE